MIKLYLYTMLQGSICSILYFVVNYAMKHEMNLRQRAIYLKVNLLLYFCPFPWVIYQTKVLVEGLLARYGIYAPRTQSPYVIYASHFWENNFILINGKRLLLKSHYELLVIGVVVTVIMGLLIAIWSIAFLISSHRVRRNMHVVETFKIGKKKIPIAESRSISSPAIVGILWPVIVFPQDEKLYDCVRDGIVAHEKRHIQNFDELFHLLTAICTAFYWMNPLVYLLYREQRLVSELICDEVALEGKDEAYKKNYMKSIIEAARYDNLAKSFYINFGFLENVVKMRVNRIMGINTQPIWHQSVARVTLVCAVICSVIFSMGYRESSEIQMKQEHIASFMEADSVVFYANP